MQPIEYYTSERVIWDNLKTLAEAGVKDIHRQWKVKRSIEPFAIVWPAQPILDSQGITVKGACSIDLPRDTAAWSETLRQLVHMTEAYALLLVEQRDTDIQVILESHHGTRSWTIPIRQSGDVRVLGDPIVQDNTNRIGILWESRRLPSS